jgi:hypothetical protein
MCFKKCNAIYDTPCTYLDGLLLAPNLFSTDTLTVTDWIQDVADTTTKERQARFRSHADLQREESDKFEEHNSNEI